jgi:hypothetical protein
MKWKSLRESFKRCILEEQKESALGDAYEEI